MIVTGPRDDDLTFVVVVRFNHLNGPPSEWYIVGIFDEAGPADSLARDYPSPNVEVIDWSNNVLRPKR